MRDLAVIGAGYWGQNLVRNLASMERLAAICDASAAVRARMARSYPGVPVVADLDELLARPDVRGVMVVVPSSRHAEVTRQVLAARKHAYVEKPVALSVAEGEELCRLAAAAGLQLMAGHLLLYHPCVRWTKAAIDRGELGDVRYLSSERLNLGKVRSDENALWSLAPHDVSVALYLLGKLPTHVAAHGFCYVQHDRGIEDVVFVTLRFEGGQGAQMHVSWLDPHKKRRLTVVGSRKMLTFDDAEAAEKIRIYDMGVDRQARLDAPAYESYGNLLTLRQGDILIPRVDMREPLRALCDAFAHAVDTGEPPLADGRNGVDVLRVLEAAQRSLDAHGAPMPVLAPTQG